MMDEFKQFLENTPVITREAKDAARTRLLRAMHEPIPAPVTRRTFRIPRLTWRLGMAAAAAAAVVVGFGVVLGDNPPAAASVQELGERAAQTAERDPYAANKGTPSTGQWMYVKESLAPLRAEPRPEVDLNKRETLELWYSLDGKKVAMDDGTGKMVTEAVSPGLTDADLAKAPVTPEEVLARIKRAVAEVPASPWNQNASEQERVFKTILDLMGGQPLASEVRAALFRALPKMEGVSVKQDAVDAAGRHGVAFAYTGAQERFEIIIDAGDYRFLGAYAENVADWQFPPAAKPGTTVPQAKPGTTAPPLPSGMTGTVKAGAPVLWSAQLETKVVGKPGDHS
ncbi:CU044_5270 family protein [Nonomuraea sp. NPDC000554]|uniref:CU044_5270 family protein n=1 Tax=Nonomuraea sp. NPDC000554 TaxID=3154259 RepID=UPI00331813CE